MLAGSSAHQRFAIDKAIELHEAALRHATSDAERARVLAALGQDHESGLDGPGAIDAYRRRDRGGRSGAAPGGRASADPARGGANVGLRWGAFPVRPNPAEIDEFIDEGLTLAEDAETRLWLLAMRGGAGIRWDAAHLSDPAFVAERTRAVNAALEGARQLGLTDLTSSRAALSGQLEFAAGPLRGERGRVSRARSLTSTRSTRSSSER